MFGKTKEKLTTIDKDTMIKTVAKTGFSAVVSVSATILVDNLAKYFLPKKLKPFAKACAGIGTYVLTNAITNGLSSVIENTIDNGFCEEEDDEE